LAGARINGEDRGDLPTLLANANLDTQFGFWINCCVSGGLQDGDMQERVPGAISELDKTEAFIRVEPFDSGVYGRTAWRRIMPWLFPERLMRTLSVPSGRRVLVITKVSTLLTPVSPSSHVYPLAVRLS
jgi:hypothetical protein